MSHFVQCISLTSSRSPAELLPNHGTDGDGYLLLLHHQVGPARGLVSGEADLLWLRRLTCSTICSWLEATSDTLLEIIVKFHTSSKSDK